jgi:hypothetical protein
MIFYRHTEAPEISNSDAWKNGQLVDGILHEKRCWTGQEALYRLDG